MLIGRNVRRLEAVEAEIAALESAGAAEAAKRSIAPLDLEKALAGDYDRLAAAVAQRYGRLDGLVHNAAVLGALAPIEHADMRNWCRVLHVNLTAAFALTQVLLPALRASDDASVIFTSSSVGRRGRANWGAYAVSKFGIEGLSQVLADELAGNSAVRVNAVNPGPTRTRLRRQAYPAENAELLPLPERDRKPVPVAARAGQSRGHGPESGLSGYRGRRRRRRRGLEQCARFHPAVARASDHAASERSSCRVPSRIRSRRLTVIALAFEQLAQIIAARAERVDLIPAIAAGAAGTADAEHFERGAAIELARQSFPLPAAASARRARAG